MANIQLNVAAWVANVEATDDAAVIAILEAYEKAYPELNATLEPQVRLQKMLEHLVGHINEVAQGQLRRDAQQAAAEAIDADPIRFGAQT